jgi:hypothetical protein
MLSIYAPKKTIISLCIWRFYALFPCSLFILEYLELVINLTVIYIKFLERLKIMNPVEIFIKSLEDNGVI